jgi:hypothetical protein
MFQIKQPDSFALIHAERIAAISADMLTYMSTSVVAGFRELFYDGETVRPRADIRRILAAFDAPAELFGRHQATCQYLLAMAPGCLAEADCTPPIPYLIDLATGAVTIPDEDA